jgi:hypothetical protein
MTQIQTFGVTVQDVQDRVVGISAAASTRGPSPNGFAELITRAASIVCGELIGAQLPVLTAENQNPVLWQNCKGAVIARAAYLVLSARNRGAPEDSIRILETEYRGYVEIIRRFPQRTGQSPTAPAAHTFFDGISQHPDAFRYTAGNGFAAGKRGL